MALLRRSLRLVTKREQLEALHFLHRPLWATALALSFLLTGCGKETSTATHESQAVTLKTIEPAPDEFDGWDLVWKGPKRALNSELQLVVLQPDGKEYARQEFAGYPGKSDNIQSSFSPGFAGGDPKVFYSQPIRLQFRTGKGELAFSPVELKSFKCRFFKKDVSGDVDWRKPFKTVDVIKE